MLEPNFSEFLATSGFAHRATFQADGSVIYRLGDRSGAVLVARNDWQRLSRDFALRMTPVRKRTRQLNIRLLPATFVFGMTVGQYLPFSGLLIIAAIFLGPLFIYWRHSRQVKTFCGMAENELVTYPQCVAAEQDLRREPRWLEIAFMVLVGPHLLIALVGEIGGPDLFRGTPIQGVSVGAVEIITFLLLGLRLAWPRVGPRLAQFR